ncbi:MAG: restriction endonuclease, partial [Rhodoferax sp.]|nr:restriction endonuclease [Rhodoferax sp.]
NATFLYFNPDVEVLEPCTDVVTFYDTRLNQENRSAEYRLYYRDNQVTEQLQEGDFCLVGARTNGELLIAVAPAGSEHERRLRYLFEIKDEKEKWTIGEEVSVKDLDLASRSILEAIGIEIEDSADDILDRLTTEFGMSFPTTKRFSAFARESLGGHIAAEDDPDLALEEWMKHEERLFRALEKAIVEVRLKEGFTAVDEFVSFSLSVQNRRKSRVGHALENHLEAVFKAHLIPYQRGAKTEGNSKPDFLFPGAKEYRDHVLGAPPLQMLAAKSTCKDRWRQVLTEAAKIPRKHLFTLETAISENQTDEMNAHLIQLVVPPSVAKTYTPAQQSRLLNFRQFLAVVKPHIG